MMVLSEVVTDEIVALRKSSGVQMKTGVGPVSVTVEAGRWAPQGGLSLHSSLLLYFCNSP